MTGATGIILELKWSCQGPNGGSQNFVAQVSREAKLRIQVKESEKKLSFIPLFHHRRDIIGTESITVKKGNLGKKEESKGMRTEKTMKCLGEEAYDCEVMVGEMKG